MEGPSHTLLRLELETHAYHHDADRAWLDLVSTTARARYAEQLARTYRFEAPLETALAYTPHVTPLVGTLASRARAPRLALDLIALDYPPLRLVPRLIAPFPSVSEALGWLYVVERSARLYEMVRRSVLAYIPDAPTHYLDDRGAHARWTELGHVLDNIARTPRIRDQIIHAAHDAFRTALDWQPAQQLRRGA